MGKTTFRVDIDGSREVLRAFRDLPKEATVELRDASGRIATDLSASVRSAAPAAGPHAAAVAKTVRPRRGVVPAFVVGGSARVAQTTDASGGDLVFGAEFGSAGPGGFRPYRGRAGYFVWPTIRRQQPAIAREWHRAAGRIAARWAR